MEVVPCSRVAHLDHHSLPYTFPDQDLLESNKIRIAEIWMDPYKKIFYRRDTLAHFIRQAGRREVLLESITRKRDGTISWVQAESPDVTERLQLQKSLGCKNFQWYLTTVYPQLYIPEDRPALSGEVWHTCTHTHTPARVGLLTRALASPLKLYNVGTASCADHPPRQGLQGGVMIMAPCSGTGSQVAESSTAQIFHPP